MGGNDNNTADRKMGIHIFMDFISTSDTPFGAPIMSIAVDAYTDEDPIIVLKRGIQTRPHSSDSNVLQTIINSFLQKLKEVGWEESSNIIQNIIDDEYKHRAMSAEEKTILMDAMVGNLKAIKQIISANPEVLRLPFVQDALITILRGFKYGYTPEQIKGCTALPTKKELKERRGICKTQWINLLPKKGHANKNLVQRLNKLLIEKGLSQSDRIETISELLGLSERTVRALLITRIKRGRC